MKENMECPVCGNTIERESYTEECWGAHIECEVHVSCPHCFYFCEMAYSDEIEGIPLEQYYKYKEQVDREKIPVYSEAMLAKLFGWEEQDIDKMKPLTWMP